MTSALGEDDRESPGSPGETFVIELPSTPSTGYGWEVVVDEDVLNVSETEFIPDRDGGIGTGGRERFSFDLVGTGATEIRFVYKRSWETEAVRSLTFTVAGRDEPAE